MTRKTKITLSTIGLLLVITIGLGWWQRHKFLPDLLRVDNDSLRLFTIKQLSSNKVEAMKEIQKITALTNHHDRTIKVSALLIIGNLHSSKPPIYILQDMNGNYSRSEAQYMLSHLTMSMDCKNALRKGVNNPDAITAYVATAAIVHAATPLQLRAAVRQASVEELNITSVDPLYR